MERTDEYNFRQDVYMVLIRAASYRASGFLSGERKACNDDRVFFSELLDASDRLLGKAFRNGKLTALYTEPFLNGYKKVVNDDFAYQVFLHQEQLSLFSNKVFDFLSDVSPRIWNVFNKYWIDHYFRSVKVLYYRLLILDYEAPKFMGLGAESSTLLYNRLLDFKVLIDSYLQQYINEATEPNPKPNEKKDTYETQGLGFVVPDLFDAGIIPYLNYIYDHIVSKEFPASARLLSTLRSQSSSETEFYQTLLRLDVPNARKHLGVGEVSAKEVNQLCDMMRRILSRPEARIVFEKSEKADLLSPHIEEIMEGKDTRTFHAYLKFMKSCNNSVLNLYLKVVGLPLHRIKVPGLSTEKSLELLSVLRSLLPDVDKFLTASKEPNGTSSSINEPFEEEAKSSLVFRPALHKLGFTGVELERIVSTNDRIGHFPLFTVISCLFARMEDRKRVIGQRALNIVYGSPIEELNLIALSFSLSRERIRQLRNSCLRELLAYPRSIARAGFMVGHLYQTQSDYDFRRIREEEDVPFSNEYITICVSLTDMTQSLIGDPKEVLLKPSSPARRLYLVPKSLDDIFSFNKFIETIEEMSREKRFYPYREDLETFVHGLHKIESPDEEFYAIVKECRQILTKGYPNNIINSQIYFPANARKTIPNLIEDILREFNRPMTAEEICEQLNLRYPDLEQVPSKVGPKALRNNNIVAISRSSTYTLAEWDHTEKRGGTIRDLAVEYLNSLFQPIAPLTDICEYIAKFRKEVKESSVKANLWADSSNRFSMYYKGDVLYVGLSDYVFGDEFILQEKRQGRRPFKDSIERLEEFIKVKGHFPYTSSVDHEEARLSRFYSVTKTNQKKGVLSDEELAEIERIDATYGHLKAKKERVGWEDYLERFVKYLTDNEALPNRSSKEYAWYEENKALYDAGELEPTREQAFSFLVKIVYRMTSDKP